MKFVWMFLSLILLCALTLNAAAPIEEEITVSDQEWQDFKTKFNKTYDTPEEDAKRRGIYLETKKRVTEHNKNYEAGLTTYSQAINNFSDLTHDEFSDRYLMKNIKIDK